MINLKHGGAHAYNQKTWDRFIAPGAHLVMYMVYEDLRMASRVCPRRNATSDDRDGLGWVLW
jgi:hypothetical protein